MPIYSISQEGYILFITILGGGLIAFIYNLYCIFRGAFAPKKIATMAQDLIFWCFIFIIAFYVLIFSNQGAIRYYNFLGFIIGTIFYQLSISRPVTKLVIFLLKSIKNFLLDTYKLIKYPFNLTLCLIAEPYNHCKKRVKPIYYKIRKIAGLPRQVARRVKKAGKTYAKSYLRKK